MVPETVLYNTHIMTYNIGWEIGTILEFQKKLEFAYS